MNNMKKFASIATAILMTACMTAPMMSLSAYEFKPSIRINSKVSGHTYEAYQIFGGKYDKTSNIFTDIYWGAGVDLKRKVNWGTEENKDEKTLVEAIQAITITNSDNTISKPFEGKKTASDIAKVLSDAAENHTDPDMDMEITKKFADVVAKYLTTVVYTSNENTYQGETINYNISGYIGDRGPSYYLVQDKAESLKGDDDAYTRYILKVVNGLTDITPKSTKPGVEKKVYEESQAGTNGGYGYGYNDVADYDTGDEVPFKLYGSLPDDKIEYEAYDAYYYQFVDKLGSEFDFEENNNVNSLVHVYYEQNDGTKKEIVNDYPVDVVSDEAKAAYDLTHIVLKKGDIVKQWSKSEHTITVTIEDIKEFAVPGEGKITVEYKAKLSDRAKVGYEGQVNGVYLNYSNNANEHWTPTKNSVPGIQPESPETPESNGKTLEDGVLVFTYGIDINKVVEELNGDLGEKLAGARFAVYCYDYEVGTETTTEKVTDPKSANQVTQVVEKNKEYEVWTLNDDTEKLYYKNNGTWYDKIVDNNNTTYQEVTDTTLLSKLNDEKVCTRNKAYVKTGNKSKCTGLIKNKNDFPNEGTSLGNENGVWESNLYNNIVIMGLDKDRVYYIEELKAPEGYNKLDAPVEVQIISTYMGSAEGASAKEIYPNHTWTYSTNGNIQSGNYTALDDIHLTVDKVEQGKINDNKYDVNDTSNTSDNDLGTVDIGNRSGAELPDTGGIGTTLFYVGGSIMVAVAGVFLITNKRAGRKD